MPALTIGDLPEALTRNGRLASVAPNRGRSRFSRNRHSAVKRLALAFDIGSPEATLERKPGFTLGDYERGSPYRRQEDLDHWLDGLRKAGIAD